MRTTWRTLSSVGAARSGCGAAGVAGAIAGSSWRRSRASWGNVEIRPSRTDQIALRLSKDDLEALRAVARRRGVGHTTLAPSVLEDWLAKVREKLGSAPRAPRHTP